MKGRALWALAIVAACAVPGRGHAQPAARRPAVRSYVCPIDGGRTRAVGSEGRRSLRRYSDLEEPTRAYQNAVLACPKCGYATWRSDFERPPSPRVVRYVHTHLERTAKRAGSDPIVAYRHHLNLLSFRHAGLREQIGAALFYSYVIKKARPYGGIDAEVERRLLKARTRVLQLLRYAMKNEPPRRERARLEWRYLIGEMLRLTGRPGEAATVLPKVCEAKHRAGHTVGRLACRMADRARRQETWEDYRDGVYDVRGIEAAERRAKQTAARAKAEAGRPKAVKPPPGTKPGPPGERTDDKAPGKPSGKSSRKGGPARGPAKAAPGLDVRQLRPDPAADPLAPPPPPPAK